MKKTLAGLLLAAGLPFTSVVAAGPAHADVTVTCDDISGSIASLRQAVSILSITGQNAEKDRTGLHGKLTEALEKVALDKDADAALKLRNFQTKLVQLAGAGKISQADADALFAAADAIVNCLQFGTVTAPTL